MSSANRYSRHSDVDNNQAPGQANDLASHRGACRRRTLQALLADEEVWASAQLPAVLRRMLAPLPPGLEIPPGGLGQQVALALRLIGRYPSFRQLDDRGDLTPSLAPPELYRQVLAVAGM